jgi:hypothetical protein
LDERSTIGGTRRLDLQSIRAEIDPDAGELILSTVGSGYFTLEYGSETPIGAIDLKGYWHNAFEIVFSDLPAIELSGVVDFEIREQFETGWHRVSVIPDMNALAGPGVLRIPFAAFLNLGSHRIVGGIQLDGGRLRADRVAIQSIGTCWDPSLDGPTPRWIYTHEEVSSAYSTALSADGRWLVYSRTNGFVVLDAQSGQALAQIASDDLPAFRSPEFSPDGAWLALSSSENRVYLWRTADWSIAYTFDGSLPTTTSFSPNSAYLAISGREGTSVVRTSDGALLHQWPPTNYGVQRWWSPDSSLLVMLHAATLDVRRTAD